jgi:hypothetical protein
MGEVLTGIDAAPRRREADGGTEYTKGGRP